MGAACARELIRRRPLSETCSYRVSRNESVVVARTGLLVACQDLPIDIFLSSFCALAILMKLDTETCVCRTKFSIATLHSLIYLDTLIKWHLGVLVAELRNCNP